MPLCISIIYTYIYALFCCLSDKYKLKTAMKKILKALSIAALVIAGSGSYAQVCPALTSNNVTLSCSTPCATLYATPNVNLASTSSYSVTSIPFAPFSYSGTSATFSGSTWSASTDDNFGDEVSLPFNFCFFGNTYSAIAIGTNGNITFDLTNVNSYDPYSISGPLPGSNCAATENCIMGVWNDTYVGGGDITYATYGTAPCRQFVISYNAVDLFLPGSFCDGNTTTSQIVLYESTNVIDIYIGNRQPCTDWNSGYAVTGIENAAGTTFYCPPGENGTTFSATNLGWRFSPSGATGGWTYQWTTSGGTVVGTTDTINVCPGTTTTYTVTATSTACSGLSITSTSTVITTGSLSPISGIAAKCVGDTAILTDTTAGGIWSSSNPAIASVSSTGIVTAVSGGVATITYTKGGCSAVFTFTSNAIPAPPVITPNSYCAGAPASPVSATGANLLWYGPGITAGNPVAPVPNTANPGTVTYYVTQTSAAGCVSDSAIDVVTVRPVPPAPATTDTSYCQYYTPVQPLSAQVGIGPGGVPNWYSSSGAALGSVSPIPTTNTPTYPGGTTWYVSQTVNGCEGPQAPVKVTIYPTPEFTLSYPSWVCGGDSANITYTLATGNVLVSPVYTWTLPPFTSPGTGYSTSGPSMELIFDSVHNIHNTGTLTISNVGRCATTDTFNIRVVPLPAASAYMPPQICVGDTVGLALTAISPDASSYQWNVDGNPLLTSPLITVVAAASGTGGPFSLVWNTSGVHTISLTATTLEGCVSKPTYDTVQVYNAPDASFIYTTKQPGGSLCLYDTVLFTAISTDPGYSYLWTPVHYFYENNKPAIWGDLEEPNSTVTLIVTDAHGCKASNSVEFHPDDCCTVNFPSAFSPNGDLHDDYFRPLFAGYHRFHDFRIFNRFGQVVYETTDNRPQWDGTFNGVPQDMGTYYYLITFDCGGQTIQQKGDVTLVR